MEWHKRGRIFVPDGSLWWAQQSAFPPVPYLLEPNRLRIYCTFCDANMVGRVAWVDVDPDDPARVLDVATEPVLDVGLPGTFDENGLLPTCVLPVGDELYMYYVGYQLGQQVRYYQFLGLARSRDGGHTWQRVQRVPVLDRSDAELIHRTSGFVRLDGDGRFHLWYVGGSEETEVDGRMLPVYEMKHAVSADGIHWPDAGETAIALDEPDEHALGRPWVVEREGGGLRMFYSSRRRSNGYRIGYADSDDDGASWVRHDAEVGIDVGPEEWDSEMVEYAATFVRGERTYMFYNGNGLGRTGFGWAELAG